MNNEIKEILEQLDIVVNKPLPMLILAPEYTKILLDYITNLQQENEYLKKTNDEKTKIGIANHKYASQMEDKVIELQQENERLKEEQEYNNYCDEQLRKKISNLEYKITTLEDYKSRCEKASEYNNQIIKDTKDFYRPTTDIIYSGDCLIDIATNNINILQNGSDDNE